jgi:hypothetical protein
VRVLGGRRSEEGPAALLAAGGRVRRLTVRGAAGFGFTYWTIAQSRLPPESARPGSVPRRWGDRHLDHKPPRIPAGAATAAGSGRRATRQVRSAPTPRETAPSQRASCTASDQSRMSSSLASRAHTCSAGASMQTDPESLIVEAVWRLPGSEFAANLRRHPHPRR